MANNIPPEVRQNLPAWKQKYGEVFFLPELGGRGLVLRNFTLGEHEIYLLESQLDPDDANEALVNKCVLWPTDFDLDNLPTPTVNIILNKLNEVSPYDNPERFFQKLEEKRSMIDTPKGQIYAYITAAFPDMNLRDIQALHFDEVATHLAIAEKVLGQSFQLTAQGDLAAVPEQGMSPAQVAQMHKHKKLQAKRAAREAALHDRRLSQAGASHPEPEVGANPLLQDRDEMMQALRGSGE